MERGYRVSSQWWDGYHAKGSKWWSLLAFLHYWWSQQSVCTILKVQQPSHANGEHWQSSQAVFKSSKVILTVHWSFAKSYEVGTGGHARAAFEVAEVTVEWLPKVWLLLMRWSEGMHGEEEGMSWIADGAAWMRGTHTGTAGQEGWGVGQGMAGRSWACGQWSRHVEQAGRQVVG